MSMKLKKLLVCLCALALTAVLLVNTASAWSDGNYGNLYMYVKTGNSGRLHLRALPTTASESLGLYPNGTMVLVESISSNWAFVQVNGRRGYMLLSCLTDTAPGGGVNVIAPPAATENTLMYVRTGNTGRLHLREYASRNARSLGLYRNGTAVVVTARSGAWAYVNVNGRVGYMMLQYLSSGSGQQSAPTVPQPVSGTPQTRYIRTGNTGRLHLREFASTAAPSLGLYPNGTMVYAVDLGNGWSQVTVNGQSGYMMTQFLTSALPAPQPTAAPDPGVIGTMYVSPANGGRLNLRAAPGEDSASLGLFAYGTPVSVLGYFGIWAYVRVEGRMGYMALSSLSASLAPAATAAPAPSTSATVIQPNGSFVYLRTSRNSSSTTNVICQVPSGARVTVAEWGDYWSRVNYDGLEGYMVTGYLH